MNRQWTAPDKSRPAAWQGKACAVCRRRSALHERWSINHSTQCTKAKRNSVMAVCRPSQANELSQARMHCSCDATFRAQDRHKQPWNFAPSETGTVDTIARHAAKKFKARCQNPHQVDEWRISGVHGRPRLGALGSQMVRALESAGFEGVGRCSPSRPLPTPAVRLHIHLPQCQAAFPLQRQEA